MKVLTRRQARWSEYLCQFNLAIRFRPGKLGEKPDSLTRRWDVYPKEGDSDYSVVNPHNFRPIFTTEQILASEDPDFRLQNPFTASLRASTLLDPVTRAGYVADQAGLEADILSALPQDPTAQLQIDVLQTIPPEPNPEPSRWSIDTRGFLCLDGRIYVPDARTLRLRILQEKHDHILAGHFGQNRTLELVRRAYTWPGLRSFVQDYVRSCPTCARAKTPRHKPYGTLKQLPISERPWDSISMDLIKQLPQSDIYTAILVIIDRLTKQAIFVPTDDKLTSTRLAELFVMNVFSKHGVPNHVTSDRGSEFVSHFFRSLGSALNMRLHFTSGYHPEGDGQTERANQTLEQYLRIYCSYQQDDWSKLLPLAEFAYNNAESATTGITPFYANKGYHPNLSVNADAPTTNCPGRDFAINLGELHEALKVEISEAQKSYQISADRHRLPAPEFPIGSRAMVKGKWIKESRPSKKLGDKNYGPFEIIARPGSHSYTLWLPQSMRSIHSVFHVSQLISFPENPFPGRIQPPPPPVEVDGEEEYKIAEILSSKIDRRFGKGNRLRYRVRWLGYEGTDEEFSEVRRNDINAEELLANFHQRYPHLPGPNEPT